MWFEDCKIQDFDLGKVVGAGSFGRVYVATHMKTNHVCVAKSLSKAAIIKSKQVKTFFFSLLWSSLFLGSNFLFFLSCTDGAQLFLKEQKLLR